MSPHRLAAFVTIGVIAVAIAVGLYFSGSPAEQRLKRLDDRRVFDLQRLSAVVNEYYLQTDALPATLDDLVDGRLLSVMPRDPVTGEAYGYEISGERRYRLCGGFSRESSSAPPGSFWTHGAGRHCFEFDYSDLPSIPNRIERRED